MAFLDDDAIPQPGWLAELTAPFADPNVWVTGGRALPNWPGQQRPGWWPEEFDWVVGCSYRGLPTRISQVRNVIGASMAMRRDTFLVAGTFREGIGRIGKKPLGGEETELCIRLGQARPGSLIVYAPASVVSHRVSGDRVRMGYFLARCFAEGVCKAQISATVGGSDATASERSYTARVLPRGVVRGLHDTLRGRLSGFARAAAIIVGLLTTTAGYACGKAGAIIVRRADTVNGISRGRGRVDVHDRPGQPVRSPTTGTEPPTSPHLLATARRTPRPSTPPPSLNQAGLAGAWKEPIMTTVPMAAAITERSVIDPPVQPTPTLQALGIPAVAAVVGVGTCRIRLSRGWDRRGALDAHPFYWIGMLTALLPAAFSLARSELSSRARASLILLLAVLTFLPRMFHGSVGR